MAVSPQTRYQSEHIELENVTDRIVLALLPNQTRQCTFQCYKKRNCAHNSFTVLCCLQCHHRPLGIHQHPRRQRPRHHSPCPARPQNDFQLVLAPPL